MAEKAQNKKNKKSKKAVSEQVADVAMGELLEVKEPESVMVSDVVAEEHDDVDIVEDEVLNEIENSVQDEKMEETTNLVEDIVDKVKDVKKPNSKKLSEDPFLIDSDVTVQQTLTPAAPKKKAKKQVMIAFDEWNGTYIM